MGLESSGSTFVAKVGNREGISDCRTGFLRDKTDWIAVATGSYESYALGNCNAPTEENGCEKLRKRKSVASTAYGGRFWDLVIAWSAEADGLIFPG